MPIAVTVGSSTSPGRVRAANQDWLGYFEPSDGASARGRLFVLADGMGGEAGGETASQMAVEVVARTYFEDRSANPARALGRSLALANEAIRAEAAATPELKGMGTTCTALVLDGTRGYLAHVGDSRAYRVRVGGIERLTQDHSLAERGPAFTHILTRALGAHPQVQPDIGAVPGAIQPGDAFILCSDGLWGQLKDQEIAEIVTLAEPTAASQRLVDLANERGGPDNITVLVVRVDAVAADGLAGRLRGILGRAFGRGTAAFRARAARG